MSAELGVWSLVPDSWRNAGSWLERRSFRPSNLINPTTNFQTSPFVHSHGGKGSAARTQQHEVLGLTKLGSGIRSGFLITTTTKRSNLWPTTLFILSAKPLMPVQLWHLQVDLAESVSSCRTNFYKQQVLHAGRNAKWSEQWWLFMHVERKRQPKTIPETPAHECMPLIKLDWGFQEYAGLRKSSAFKTCTATIQAVTL